MSRRRHQAFRLSALGAVMRFRLLVIHDLLGIFDRFTPKFVKKYATLNGTIIDALSTYAKEVEDGTFPGPEHSFGMVEEELQRLY